MSYQALIFIFNILHRIKHTYQYLTRFFTPSLSKLNDVRLEVFRIVARRISSIPSSSVLFLQSTRGTAPSQEDANNRAPNQALKLHVDKPHRRVNRGLKIKLLLFHCVYKLNYKDLNNKDKRYFTFPWLVVSSLE